MSRQSSCLAHYLDHGDEKTYKMQFRMTKTQLHRASDAFAAQGFLTTNDNQNPYYRIPAHFKFAVCMFVVAHGGNATSPWKPAADAACLGLSTVESYMPLIIPLVGSTLSTFQLGTLVIYCLLELNMLCDCVTRGCGDHSPLTTAAILEWRRRSAWGGAAAARRGLRGLGPDRPGIAGRCSPVGSRTGDPPAHAR